VNHTVLRFFSIDAKRTRLGRVFLPDFPLIKICRSRGAHTIGTGFSVEFIYSVFYLYINVRRSMRTVKRVFRCVIKKRRP
jgi:hypothetical protein